LDTSANSIPYLASWAGSAPLEVLERAAALTGRISDRIDAALLADVEQDCEPVERAAAA